MNARDSIHAGVTVDGSSLGRGVSHRAQDFATPKHPSLAHPNWFAIHAKPRRESFAETNVRTLGHDVFLPKLRVEGVARGKRCLSSKPLFRGYFFARFCPEISLESVKCARGVLQVVSSGRFPIPVDENVIQEIQDRVEADGCIRICRQALKPGDLVLIEGGPLRGIMGRVERECDDQNRVAILLETLWNARMLIEEHYVQPAAT
jgi:transcriptional antiterminator RfaH